MAKDLDKDESSLTLEQRLEQESADHSEKERLLNEKIDSEIEKYIDNPVLGIQAKSPVFSRPSNPSLIFIVPNEFAERFCYYGITPLLKNLFGKVMGMNTYYYGLDGKLIDQPNTAKAVSMKSTFTSITYFTPVIGALVSDSFLDKYHTIVSFSLLYMTGVYLLFAATNPSIFGFDSIYAPILTASPFNQTVIDSGVQFIPNKSPSSTAPHWAIYSALGLIALGAGGIKPCVSAHGGDQFLPRQNYALQMFYNLFYVAINLGAVLSGIISPAIRDGECFAVMGGCFSYSFLMCAVMFSLALGVFIFGKRFYRVVPPAGRFIFADIVAAGFYSLFNGRAQANKKYGNAIVTEAIDLIKVISAIWPTVFFNVAYDQLGGAWQDTTDRMGNGFGLINSEQIQNFVNPALIFFVAPIMAKYCYPKFPKFGFLQRMAVGMVLMIAASVSAALIDRQVSSSCVIDDTLTEDDPLFRICASLDISNLWFLIPVTLLTIGEVLVNVSGLNFTYTEVGKRTKSFSSALWLLTTALGSFIASKVITILGYGDTLNSEGYYYWMAGFAAVGTLCQLVMVKCYVYKADRT